MVLARQPGLHDPLQDGAHDQENIRAGSWILANIELANSLKTKGYDYHFSLGPGTHSQRQGSAELPQSPEVFLTGGAAAHLVRPLGFPCRYEPHLVLSGIALARP